VSTQNIVAGNEGGVMEQYDTTPIVCPKCKGINSHRRIPDERTLDRTLVQVCSRCKGCGKVPKHTMTYDELAAFVDRQLALPPKQEDL
jgi:DnaJ-class molecular chaperone